MKTHELKAFLSWQEHSHLDKYDFVLQLRAWGRVSIFFGTDFLVTCPNNDQVGIILSICLRVV